MKKLRNLDQLSPERRAMLQAMLEMPKGTIAPKPTRLKPIVLEPEEGGRLLEARL
jgi:hypothetical protein